MLIHSLSLQEVNPVDVAVRYLKQDFIKSLLVRLELVLDKWTDDAAGCSGKIPASFRASCVVASD